MSKPPKSFQAPSSELLCLPLSVGLSVSGKNVKKCQHSRVCLTTETKRYWTCWMHPKYAFRLGIGHFYMKICKVTRIKWALNHTSSDLSVARATLVEPFPNPQNSGLWPLKAKVRSNKSCSSGKVDSNSFFFLN